MIGPHIARLLSTSGVALCNSEPRLPVSLVRMAGTGSDELLELLVERNGFYAFESALHIFPSNCSDSLMDIETWNTNTLWRDEFGAAAKELVFFAEDAFGEQFAISQGSIYRFDPESAAVKEFGSTLDDWAERILLDYAFETGYQQIHEWQQRNGKLGDDQRLIPKTPFVLGGSYEVDNLFALDAVKAMRYRADIWKQIRDLPDGTPVQFKVIW